MSLANHPNALSGGASPTTGVIAGGTLVGLNGQTIVGNASGSWVITANGTAQAVDIADSTGQNTRFTNKHILLGGLTTDGIGVLQFPTATTSAGGITAGTDTNWFRSAPNTWSMSTGGTVVARYFQGVAVNSYIDLVNGSNGISFYTAGTATLALVLDASQNATFSGFIRPVNLATASAPAYAKGVIYFDTTLNKLRVGGATAFETITSV